MKRFNKISKKLLEPKVFMVRHGHTDFNGTDKSEDRIRGHIDVPLNEEGKHDAIKARDQLKKYSISKIYSSDLIRAKQTALIINENFHVPITYSFDLRPWDLGDYQGRLTKEVIDDLNKMVRNEHLIPENGESFGVFRIRLISYVHNIINEAIQKNLQLVIVSHFRDLKTIDAWIEHGAPDDYSIDTEVMITDKFKPGEVWEIPIDKIKKG